MDTIFAAFDCPCNGKVLEKGAMFPVFGNITHSRRQLVKEPTSSVLWLPKRTVATRLLSARPDGLWGNKRISDPRSLPILGWFLGRAVFHFHASQEAASHCGFQKLPGDDHSLLFVSQACGAPGFLLHPASKSTGPVQTWQIDVGWDPTAHYASGEYRSNRIQSPTARNCTICQWSSTNGFTTRIDHIFPGRCGKWLVGTTNTNKGPSTTKLRTGTFLLRARPACNFLCLSLLRRDISRKSCNADENTCVPLPGVFRHTFLIFCLFIFKTV